MGHEHKLPSALRLERFVKGVTLRDLEQATGRSRMFWQRVETGGSAKLDSDLARKVADALGISPDRIFEGFDR